MFTHTQGPDGCAVSAPAAPAPPFAKGPAAPHHPLPSSSGGRHAALQPGAARDSKSATSRAADVPPSVRARAHVWSAKPARHTQRPLPVPNR